MMQSSEEGPDGVLRTTAVKRINSGEELRIRRGIIGIRSWSNLANHSQLSQPKHKTVLSRKQHEVVEFEGDKAVSRNH
jgi:hypothetical protein